MTVSIQTPVNSYTANGVATLFSFAFLLLDENDINVYVDNILKTIGIDYTVSGVGNPAGGSVTFLSAPAAGLQVVLERDSEIKRDTDYQDHGDFEADVVNADFDRLWLAMQEILYKYQLAPSLLPGSPLAGGIRLPSPEVGKYLRWNIDEDNLENGDPDFYRGTILPDGALIATAADIAITPMQAGQIFELVEYYSGTGKGGGQLKCFAGTITPDNGITFAGPTGFYLRRINYDFVTLEMFGAKGDGVTNDCDKFRAAIAASKNICLLEGVYLISPTAGSGDFMLYLGTANGNSDRSGMKICGQGRKSVIKLGNAVGANKLLFGAASTDVLNNMEFSDFAIDLNGQNNLQANFGDPLRYNSAFYMYAKCSNFLFKNLYISNISGHQAIRVGAEDANKYGDNIRLIDCHFENFGTAIAGNNQQDVSVCYIQADRITIEGGSFKNPNFTFDLARGQTCFELHGDSSTKIHGVNFAYAQLPILIVSSFKSNRNVVVEQCVFNECNYFASLDSAEYDQTNIKFVNCEYQSTKVNSVILPLGSSTETAKNRERIEFLNNTINCTGNTNQDTHVFSIEDNYIKSLIVKGNTIKSINGCLLYTAGTIRNSDVLTIDISDNHLDSLGSASGSFPNDPAFVFIAHTTGGINSIVIDGNQLYNTEAKNYSAVGAYRLAGRILNTYVDNTSGALSKTYPIVTESSVTGVVTKVIESNAQAMPVRHRSQNIALAGTSSVNLYDFTSFGNNDVAMLEIKIFANVGGTANGTVQSWDVLYSSNGKVIEKESGGGTYNADVILELSGTILRVRSTTGTALTFNYIVTGDTNKNIVWLV